jgi:hypothetical protein
MRLLSPFAVAGVLLLVVPAFAGPPDAQTILKQMKAALEPERPSIRTLTFTVHSEGYDVQWTARQARKKLPDGNRMLTVILAPADVEGTATLLWEQKDGQNEQWYYVPEVRRVRRVGPVSAYESFLGSDFTLADLGFVDLRDRQVKLLGEEKLDSTPAYKLEEVLAGTRYYISRIVTWVAKDSMLPLRRDYYDPANELWKKEFFEESTDIDGTPTVLLFRMQDSMQNTSTTMRVSGVQYDAPVPDDLFDPQRLPLVSKHPLWGSTAP